MRTPEKTPPDRDSAPAEVPSGSDVRILNTCGDAKPRRALVVDDDPTGMAALVELLQAAGYRVQGAASFEEAKRLLMAEHPDLLITDVRLGAFNGLQLLVLNGTEHPGMTTVVISGFSDPVIEAEARKHGAAFLLKPIEPLELLKEASRRAVRPSY
jgi:DNA-binding NtrC family response regulator